MSKQILRIGVDIDDVLFNSAVRSIEIYNQSFGTQVTLDDWYDFVDPSVYGPVWGTEDLPTIVKRVVGTLMDEAFSNVDPVEGAQKALAYLDQEGHKIFAITGRSENTRSQTKSLLDVHFPGLFTDETLFFVDHFEHEGKKVSKAEIGLQLGLTHFIEDLPSHANGLAGAGIKTVLLNTGNYKWSISGIDPAVSHNVVELDSWPLATEYFDVEAAR